MVRRATASGGGEQVISGLAQFINRPEKVIPTPEVNGITDEARRMAAELKVAFSRGERTEVEEARDNFRQIFFDRLDALNAPAEMNIEMLMGIADGLKGEGSWSGDDLQVVQLAYDIKDAAALAMLANAGDYPRDMEDALVREDANALESHLGLTADDELKGLGAEMINAAVVNPDLAKCLATFQLAVSSGNTFEGVKRAIGAVSRLMEDGADTEMEVVFRYLNEIQAGMSQGRGRGGRPDVFVPGAPPAPYDAASGGPGAGEFGGPEIGGRPFDITQDS